MEHLLWLYAQPYDPRFPVVCFDERPCFPIGEALAPLPLQAGPCYYPYPRGREDMIVIGLRLHWMTYINRC